jgi:K+-sensing histidine kinase KdpD
MAILKERRDCAVSAKRAKCEFLANMSHQLRTPMNAVIGYSEMLLEDLSASGQHSSELEKVHELGQLLLSRTNDVLDLAKMEMGRLPIFVENITLSRLASNFDAIFSVAVNARGNRLELSLADSSAQITTDARKACQVVQHVFSAVNDAVQGGRILTHLHIVGERLVCTVLAQPRLSDLGTLQAIFHDNFPSDKSSADRQSARLAMALSRHLSAALGGHVAFIEKQDAAGFVIEIPSMGNNNVPPGEISHDLYAASH